MKDSSKGEDFGPVWKDWPLAPDLGAEAFFQFCSHHPSFQFLQRRIGHQFDNIYWPIRSLCHRSFVHEWPQLGLHHNERLEFLGDSLLGAVVSAELFRRFPQMQEGPCSILRGALVNEENLAALAKELRLGDCLLLGRGEIQTGGMKRTALLADAFEALIGALFQELGFEGTQRCLLRFFASLAPEWDFFDPHQIHDFDPKTKLQEFTMATMKTLPRYEATQDEQSFRVSLIVGDEEFGPLKHHSKKKAQKILAKKALAKLQGSSHAD